MRPNPLIVRRYLARSGVLWLAVRSASGLVMAFAGANPLKLSGDTLLVVFLLTIAVGFIEVSRRREWALLGNLGVSPVVLGCIFAAPAMVGEAILRVLGSAR